MSCNLRPSIPSALFPVIAILLLLVATPTLHSQQPLTIESGVELQWPTTPGNHYQLQWSPSPDNTEPWTDLGSVIPGSGSPASHHDPVPAGTRHYRVQEIVPGTPPVSTIPLNGGFESGTGSTAVSWNTSASQPPARSDADAHTGSFSMRSSLDNVGNAPSEGLLNSVPGPTGSVSGGESYNFSFWARQIRSSATYIQQHRVQWLDDGGGVIGSTGLQNFNDGTGAWTLISVPNLIAPPSASTARIDFRFVTGAVTGGSGEVFIDDVMLQSAGGSSIPGPGQTNLLPVTHQPVAAISWPTTLGTQYQPTSTTNLASHDWNPIAPPIVGDGAQRTFRIPMTHQKEFIRVESPDPPSTNLSVIPLFSISTLLEPPTTLDTADALITRVGDRGRGRHAREDGIRGVRAGPEYDVYLKFYWEGRTVAIEIVDRVARGGSDITVNITSSWPLATRDFRAFYRGVNTFAEYHANIGTTEVGPNQYTTTLSYNQKERRAIQLGDRMEFEFSPFLDAPENGRANYYGTAMLYIVGEGIKPWQAEGPLLDSYPLPEIAWLGGKTTQHYPYSNEPQHLFKQMAGNLAPTNAQPFMLGRRLHHTDFESGTHSEGGNPAFSEHIGKVGPSFMNRSCVACHVNNGRALPPAIGEPMDQTVVKVGSDANGSPDPILGSLLQPFSISGPAEGSATLSSYTIVNGQYSDGTSYSLQKPNYTFQNTSPAHFSVRLAPQLVGLGLLEAISEHSILALADPDDGNLDGISGRAQSVIDPETGQTRLGRFGHKAGKARLRHQIASALNTDMGVTTSLFPGLDGEPPTVTPELGETELDYMTRYIAALAVNARRDIEYPQALRGEQLFTSARCADCHTPEIATSPHHPMTELRNQTIRPYTDLLLHDMGPGLADNMGEGTATGSEWRTPPLWNIGLTLEVSDGEAYLHDGRARTLEEAILWHGGEGETSRETFRNLSAADRAALIRFLKSL